MSNETPEKNRKIGRIVAVTVAVIVIAALIVGGARKGEAPTVTGDMPEGCKPGFLFSETTGKPCPQPEDTSTTEEKTDAGIPTAYEAALKEYAGKLVAFDATCKQVAGIGGAVAAGTRILVANNSPKQLTIAVDGKKETLDGYHYFTTTVKTKGDVKVSCENTDAATIKVQ